MHTQLGSTESMLTVALNQNSLVNTSPVCLQPTCVSQQSGTLSLNACCVCCLFPGCSTEVAVKVVYQEDEDEGSVSAGRAQLRNALELAAVTAVSHPNIVQVSIRSHAVASHVLRHVWSLITVKLHS
jgi:hypothetical protein